MRDSERSRADELSALPNATVELLPRLDLPGTHEDLMKRLAVELPLAQRTIRLWGKSMVQPRLIAWVAGDGLSYRYSGETLEPEPWTPLLSAIRRCVERACGHAFNSVLVNYYRDHNDSMGMHSDDETELGPRPIIASLSLGAERTFVMQHRFERNLPRVRLPLPSGSLLIMRGETQQQWKHGIPKQRKPCEPRMNLTFRTILSSTGPEAHHVA